MHLGVLALPGDGGHLTDFVANLWSIGAGGMALVTLIIQAKPKPWFFYPRRAEMSFPPLLVCSDAGSEGLVV